MPRATSRIFVFPGQGSQRPGMGAALADAFPAARETFHEVDEALGEHLSRLMQGGPEDELMLTRNAQPALMASSIAVLRVLQAEGGQALGDMCAMVAGHSLGEYSALVAGGALPLDAAARLLRLRGDAMQAAVPVGEGAMAAILGLEIRQVEEIAAQASGGGVCAVANDNAPGQAVVSGSAGAVEKAVAAARAAGARRAMTLQVSAPFHCPLMQPAAERMAEALAETALAPTAVPVIANVTAAAESAPETLRRLLVEQITARVRWRESMQSLGAAGIALVVELGTGKVLAGLARRCDRELDACALEEPRQVEAFLASL